MPRVCSFDGCEKPHVARGYCSMHVTRLRRNGDPAIVQRVWVELQPCVVCGSEDRSIKSRRFCSKRCEQHYYRHGGNVPRAASCEQCGCSIDLTVPTRQGNRRRISGRLCESCRKDWRKQCLSVDELAARDGTDCAICGEPVDMTLRRSDSLMCPSIEHIVPRSRGGSHDPSNLALAHLLCNIRKADRVEGAAS